MFSSNANAESEEDERRRNECAFICRSGGPIAPYDADDLHFGAGKSFSLVNAATLAFLLVLLSLLAVSAAF